MKTFGISHRREIPVFFFYHRPWRKRRKATLQSFWTNASIPSNQTCFGFSQMRKFSARIRWWTNRTTISSFCPHKIYRYWPKPNIQFTSWCLRWSLTMVTLYFHSSSHTNSRWRPTWNAWRRCCCFWLRGWLLEDHTSGNRILHHVTQAELSIGCEIISATIYLPTSGCLHSLIAILLIIICETWLRERPTKLCVTPKINWKQG